MVDRVVAVSGYLPHFLRGVRELNQVAVSEDEEMSRLYGRMDRVWADGFIQTADLQGIKRWESILGIKAYTGDGLDDRRATVLGKWNQQLPYTLPRLKERLDAAVGQDRYVLEVRYGRYELELVLIDQAYRVLQEIRDMTKIMIPANLLLVFAGKFPVTLPVKNETESGLGLLSEFHARYNRKFLLLDGTWVLDGTYKLNGFKELMNIDLYPMNLTIGGACKVLPDCVSVSGCRSDVVVKSGVSRVAGMSAAVTVEVSVDSGSHMGADVVVGSVADLVITVEKNLWHLDGTCLMDGSKLLNAQSIRYE